MLPHCEGIATEALQSAEFCKEILCSSLTFFHPHVWDGGRWSCENWRKEELLFCSGFVC